MAVGDTVTVVPTSVSAAASLTIQPASGVEWIIHNLYVPSTATIELYRTDGTNPILVDSNAGGYLGYFFHLTNANYMTIKNTTAGAIYMSYDGIVSKE